MAKVDELQIKNIEHTAAEVHQFITHPDASNQHAIILSGNDGTDTQHYIAYSYISNGDGFGRSVYCSSKTYKTYKGALKKAAEYLS